MDTRKAVKIRRATVADASEFLRLEARCFGMSFGANTLYYWRPIVDYCWAFKAVFRGRMVGGIMALPTRDGRIYINSVFVDPAHRRRGIATRLLSRVLGLRDKAEYVLDTYVGKPHLVRFYRDNGFRVVALKKNYYRDGSTRVMMVRTCRRL